MLGTIPMKSMTLRVNKNSDRKRVQNPTTVTVVDVTCFKLKKPP